MLIIIVMEHKASTGKKIELHVQKLEIEISEKKHCNLGLTKIDKSNFKKDDLDT